MVQQHNKIINAAAKKILSPQGLFRVGTSRTWLDDNGYFMVIVEFQPSSYMKGCYLNVGVSFLWESSKDLNDVHAFNYGCHVGVGNKGFATYIGDDSMFQEEMEEYSKCALEKVMEYRQFRDMDYAKKQMENQLKKIKDKRKFWEPYQLSMLCFLKRDYEDGIRYFYDYLQLLKNSFYQGDLYIEWHEDFYNYCIQSILPQIGSEETAQTMVLDMIQRRRSFFSSKPSHKKMKRD